MEVMYIVKTYCFYGSFSSQSIVIMFLFYCEVIINCMTWSDFVSLGGKCTFFSICVGIYVTEITYDIIVFNL